MIARIDFLGILFVVWGLLTALIGVSTLALGIAAVALLASANRGSGGEVAAGLTAAAFIALALIAIGWGAGHVIVGLPLRRRRPWTRLAAMTLGAVDLLLVPFGTALGIYAIWLLLEEESKKLFSA